MTLPPAASEPPASPPSTPAVPVPAATPASPSGAPAAARPAGPAAVRRPSGRRRPAADEGGRTPPHPGLSPERGPAGYDLRDPRLLLNRELTWLNFNFRVLHEAEDPRTPLLERVKFLAIVGSNLDEFFMKRIGGLKQQVGAGIVERSVDGRTPAEQVAQCIALVRELGDRHRATFVKVVAALRKEGILLATYEDLSDEDRAWLRAYYVQNIYPLVTPQATDPAHPFPFISNLSLNLLVSLRYGQGDAPSLARVKVPVGTDTPRFIQLPGRRTFVRMESVMAHNLDLLFPGMEIDRVSVFRVTRNANTEIEEERADDLLAMIEMELRERKFAPVVRLEVDENLLPHQRGMLAAELGLDESEDVFVIRGMFGKRDLFQIAALAEPSLHDPPYHAVDHPELSTDRNIFHVVRDAGSILLFHPYQSFSNSVERFLREASLDPKVRAIKMCLYRTSATSKVVDCLVDAARNGKQVAVVVEIKARFDEAANIRWASRLEEAGIHVTYGVVGLKTHCKVILVIRQDFNGLRRYAHIGTGNYHAETARLYSDIGLITSDREIGHDLTELLNYLTTGFMPRRHYLKILPSPKVLKPVLLEKIEREIAAHSPASPGLIQFKTNALEDPDVTRALYRASQAGVQVDLIVRDTCRIRPGVPGLSDNVRVVSIVGRFLEHARIYRFRNGGAEEYYVGSADCMVRNLESRVEVLSPVDPPELRAQLDAFFALQWNDHRGAWDMQPDGSYVQRRPRTAKESEHVHTRMMRWAEGVFREATRLRRRKPRGITRRNVR
jgi:polyphosphate kinase